MAKTYRPYVPEQDLLLPPSLRDWLPEDHLAYFVSDLIDQLDLSAITAVYEDEERGYPPYHPVMLTKVLVYAYCVGVFSSRKIQRRLIEDVPFRVLAAGNEPDFRTIADFRKRHLAALRGFFEQVLRVARELGAPRVGRVALDGSKIKANASKHKAMSYGRMRDKSRRSCARKSRSCSPRRRRPMRRRTRNTVPINAATSCRRNCSGARVGCSGFATPNGRWRRERKRRPPRRANPGSRRSRIRRCNTTSPIRNRGS
jgi:transposase